MPVRMLNRMLDKILDEILNKIFNEMPGEMLNEMLIKIKLLNRFVLIFDAWVRSRESNFFGPIRSWLGTNRFLAPYSLIKTS